MSERDSKRSSRRRWIVVFGLMLMLVLYVQSYTASRDVGYSGLAGVGSVKVIILNYHWITDDTRFYLTFRAIHYPCNKIDQWLNPNVKFSTLY